MGIPGRQPVKVVDYCGVHSPPDTSDSGEEQVGVCVLNEQPSVAPIQLRRCHHLVPAIQLSASNLSAHPMSSLPCSPRAGRWPLTTGSHAASAPLPTRTPPPSYGSGWWAWYWELW